MQKISFKYNGTLITVSVKDKFNKLTILDIFKDKVVCAKCQCECGKIIEKIVLRNLIDGNTKSCGCLNAELRQQRNFRHGDSTRNNKTMTLTDWSKHLGIKRTTLSSRLRRGWTVEKAFTTN